MSTLLVALPSPEDLLKRLVLACYSHAIRVLLACDTHAIRAIWSYLMPFDVLRLLLRLADLLLRPSLFLPEQSDTVRQEDGVLSYAKLKVPRPFSPRCPSISIVLLLLSIMISSILMLHMLQSNYIKFSSCPAPPSSEHVWHQREGSTESQWASENGSTPSPWTWKKPFEQ